MNDAKLKDALAHVRPKWDDPKAERSLFGTERKRRRRAMARGATAVVTLVAALTTLAFVLSNKPNGSSENWVPDLAIRQFDETQNNNDPVHGEFRLPDGTRGKPLNEQSRLSVLKTTEQLVLVRVDSGQYEFEVTPDNNRLFKVQAGEVTVTVLGTTFSVGLDGEETHVKVTRGRVQVDWKDGTTVLSAGSQGAFPPEKVHEPPDGELLVTDKKNGGKKSQHPRDDWRHFARNGEFDKAAETIEKTKDVGNSVEDLLLAADAMRLSGRPALALPYLEKVSNFHRTDPRTPMAEFTRGRVLLLQLGQPRAAASAFRLARELAPTGNLAQDSMAREVEALHAAGELENARLLAEEYVERYPKGRRLRAVRRFGGLD